MVPDIVAVHYESESRGRIPEEYELLQLWENGIPVADLFADFEAELQPMVIDIRPPQPEPDVVRFARQLSSRRRLSQAAVWMLDRMHRLGMLLDRLPKLKA